MKLWTNISSLLMNIQVNPEMFIIFSRKCGQKHEIMDKIFESTYEHLSEPKKCSYNFLENVDKNMKLWTKFFSLLMNI